MTYKTKGIIIARKDFFEADRLTTIFSKEFGKIRVVAKGVRKILSKNGGQIELFTFSNFIFAEGKNLDILVSADSIENFKNIRNNLTKTSQAYFLAELIDRFCQENELNVNIFQLLLNSLRYLNKVSKISIKYPAWFSWRLLFLLGFGPEIYYCVECRKRLIPAKNYLDSAKGGIVCPNCHKFAKISLEISPEAIKLLRVAAKSNFSYFNQINIKHKNFNNFQKAVDLYLEYIAEKEFKSKKFIKKIKNMI